MEQNIIGMFNRMIDLFEKGKMLRQEYALAKKEGKAGKMQQLRLRYKALEDKIRSLNNRLKSKLICDIVYVTYLYNGKEVHGNWVNMTDDEIRSYYQLLGRFKGAEIEILKIERYKTFISDVPLDSL